MNDQDAAPVETYEQAPRQLREKAQAAYGVVMYKLFCGLIALHRIRKIMLRDEVPAGTEERKKWLEELLANVLKQLGPDDKARAKAFSAELMRADLSSHDDVIIEDVLRKVTR